MKPAKISIIMPVKNASQWLEECLASIHAQSFEDWEFIAVDDGSKDGSFQLLEKWASKDERIRCMKNESTGIIPALKLALENSSAPLITRMDADDIMPKDKLERFFDASVSNPGCVITGRVQYFSEKKISDGYLEYEAWLNARCDEEDHNRWIYRECSVASANWLAPRQLVEFEKDVYPEDYNLVFHWYKKGIEIVVVNHITHKWREHSKRTSRTSKNYVQEAFFDLKMKRFLENDRDANRPLIVMGKNKKAKLISKFLIQHNIQFDQLDLENLHRFPDYDQPQVLVAVFPAELVREGISDLLQGFGLEMGSDWWWL